MRILTLHNRYIFRGGEDESTEGEELLLREHGHEVFALKFDNGQIQRMNLLAVGLRSVWNVESYSTVRMLIRDVRPDVVKVHNFFPLISPSVYYAADAERVPVVQALHNYRLLCPAANFFRNGSACEDCAGKSVHWPGVVHGCYRGSRGATAAVAAMTGFHRALRTWSEKVSLYVTPSEFARRKFEEGGFPREKIVVKPNFLVRDPGTGDGRGGYGLFVGRLSAEKGIGTLLAAWRRPGTAVPLKIVGEGPLEAEVTREASINPAISCLGRLPASEVCELMGAAAFVVVPSECYETFGRVVIEAFAKGIPVIASNIGALAELVDHRRTGLLFRPGDPQELALQVDWLLSHPAEAHRMGREARTEFEAKYTAERNYRMLMEIYEQAIRTTGTASREAVSQADSRNESRWDELLGRGSVGD